ncbi:MAG: RICIN domain-containing protein, partial [Myxococcota bacterium]
MFAAVAVRPAYQLVAQHSQLCLGVDPSDSSGGGAYVAQLDCDANNDNRLWDISGSKRKMIFALKSNGLLLDVPDMEKEEWTNVGVT